MLAAAIVMFREVLEAALIVAVVLGAGRGIPGRNRWVATGICLGLGSAAVVAVLASVASRSFSGEAQAWLNAIILLAAVGMLAWHNIWMRTHGRELAGEIRAVGEQVLSGQRPVLALMIITWVAVMREGSEAVLFLWAIAAGGDRTFDLLSGGVAGMMAGAGVGGLLYLGLLRIPLRHFFSVTSAMILLLAAGLSAQAAGFLNQLGVLPSLGTAIWNTSAILSQSSLPGQLLHILVGYIARPSGIELVFYAGTVLIILLLTYRQGRNPPARP
ncbi:MAG: FTR1 family protein [Betaproteobacteria bacterium]|nr:FTR1 family protein [Betaproteobacteria bacterium]